MREEIFFGDGAVKGGGRADFVALKSRNDPAQIVWSDAHISVRQHQDVVPRFPRQPRELVHFAVGAQMLCTDEKADTALGKFSDDLLNERDGRIACVIHGKQNLVVRVILLAEACEILV